MIDGSSISKDASEFEHEFNIIYPNGIPHSEERINLENEIRDELINLKNNSTGKKKEYYKQFLKHIKQESLKGNIRFMLENYSNIIDYFKSIFCPDISYEEISSECSGIRNTIDHGKKDKEITSNTAVCYVILRMLIYSMQLKRMGLDDENIVFAIKDLYRLEELASYGIW